MKQLDKFPVHGNTKQDWNKLLDGKVYELEAGIDFTCKPQSFRSLALGQARKRQGKVTTRVLENGNLVLKFVKVQPVDETETAEIEEGTGS